MVRGEPEIQFSPPPQLRLTKPPYVAAAAQPFPHPHPHSKGRPPSWPKIKHQLVQLYQTLSQHAGGKTNETKTKHKAGQMTMTPCLREVTWVGGTTEDSK